MKVIKQHMRSVKKEEHLIFRIGNSYYSIEVSKAYSIVEMSRIKSVLKSNGSIIGYVSQRNIIFPVVDIHTKLGMPETDYTDNTCVLVLELVNERSKLLLGVLIDSLLEISEINVENVNNKKNLSPASYFNGSYIFRNNEQVTIINPDKMFSLQEIKEFNTLMDYRNN